MPVLPSTPIDPEQQRILLQVAREAIRFGLEQQRLWQPQLQDYPPLLRDQGASFVTLKRQGALRGCIGAIQAYQPLVLDVARHAYDAAFRDHRFSPLCRDEFADLSVHVSVLSQPEPMQEDLREQQLLAQLVPDRDGLILQQGQRRAVFLPQVWEQLPDPREFVQQLKRKGGWRLDEWPEEMRALRFEVQEFGD